MSVFDRFASQSVQAVDTLGIKDHEARELLVAHPEVAEGVSIDVVCIADLNHRAVLAAQSCL